MKLTDAFVKSQEQALKAYWEPWKAKCREWLGYVRGDHTNVKVPAHMRAVFPPVARRVIYGLAQQIRVGNRRVHCPPARNSQGRETAEAQGRSSERENAHRAAFTQDDIFAQRKRRYPPGHGALLESLLFGLSAELVLPNELALGPEPARRAGEGLRDYEGRKRKWEAKRLVQPALPGYLPGILNLLLDPSNQWFIWDMRIPTDEAKGLLSRWGSDWAESAGINSATVRWREVFSDESRLVYCEERLVREQAGYNVLPLASAFTTKGEPAIYGDLGLTNTTPERMFAGLLAGCESVLDDVARKESQIANYISRRVWPKKFWHGDNVPKYLENIDWDPAVMEKVPKEVEILEVGASDLPNDVWKSVDHMHTYIEQMTQIDAMQGYRQAQSGYQEALLGGLAAAVLFPYVEFLNAIETQVAENRNLYVYLSDLLPDGLEIAGRVGGKWLAGSLKREDMDSLVVDVQHEARLPQQRVTESAFWRGAYEDGVIPRRVLAEEGYGREDPESDMAQRMAEEFFDSEEVKAIKTRDFALSYDADLMRRIDEMQAEGIEQVAGAVRQVAPQGLAAPGTALPGGPQLRVVGQPTPAQTPEGSADLVARQMIARRMPAGRR